MSLLDNIATNHGFKFKMSNPAEQLDGRDVSLKLCNSISNSSHLFCFSLCKHGHHSAFFEEKLGYGLGLLVTKARITR